MDFSLADYVPRRFDEVVAVLAHESDAIVAAATEAAGAAEPAEAAVLATPGEPLAVDHRLLGVGPARVATLPVAWHASDGTVVIDGVLRVLPVDDGADPVSELLLAGTYGTLAAERERPLHWLRHVLDVVAFEIVRAAPSAPVEVARRRVEQFL